MSGRRNSILFALPLLLVGCGKSDLIGTWTGVTSFDESKARYPVTSAERERIRKLQAAQETLVLGDDGNFVWTTSGLPDGDTKLSGSWAEKEKTVTLIYKERDGKPAQDALRDWRVYQIEPSRKRLVYEDATRPELTHSFERGR
mgnify:CR=1 FL=1